MQKVAMDDLSETETLVSSACWPIGCIFEVSAASVAVLLGTKSLNWMEEAFSEPLCHICCVVVGNVCKTSVARRQCYLQVVFCGDR